MSFNPVTWWGNLFVPGLGVVEFHATCVAGWRTGSTIDDGQDVKAIFSDVTRQKLLTVILEVVE